MNLLTEDLKPRTGFVQLNQRIRLSKFSQHHVDGMPLDRTPIEFLQRDFPGTFLRGISFVIFFQEKTYKSTEKFWADMELPETWFSKKLKHFLEDKKVELYLHTSR